nr:hypothetical protein BaRGS_023921 [Batillaria attramentaria]
MSGKLAAGVFVAIACVIALVFNVFALVVYNRRKRLHKRGHLLPLFHLAVVDVLAVVTWSSVTVAIAVADWSLPAALCQAQAYFRSLWCTLHVHTLAALAIERAIRLVKPSRHVAIFMPRVVVFLLVGLWVFDVLLASVPHYGWLEFKLMDHQLQCSADYTDSVSTLGFEFTITFFLPCILVFLPCYLLLFWKVSSARKRSTPKGEIVLEDNPYSPGDSYAQKVKGFQNKFKDAGTKPWKPRLGTKKFTSQGYISDSDSDLNEVSQKEERTLKKRYILSRRDYVLTKTYVIITCVYVIVWLPYVAVTFLVNNEPYKNVPDWLVTIVTCLTHSTSFILPLTYFLHNDTFRRSAVKTLSRKKM